MFDNEKKEEKKIDIAFLSSIEATDKERDIVYKFINSDYLEREKQNKIEEDKKNNANENSDYEMQSLDELVKNG